MDMKRIEDDKYYYYRHQNKDGWIIGLHRVMYGTRVVIYRDDTFINGNFCGGDNPEMVRVLFNSLYRWVSGNPINIRTRCAELHNLERKRPFGNDLKFMWELTQLEKEDNTLDHPVGIFELKPITGF